MRGRRILYLSLAIWIIFTTYDVINVVESGPLLPTPLHNLILSVLITLTIVGTILIVHDRAEPQPQPGRHPEGHPDDRMERPDDHTTEHLADRPEGPGREVVTQAFELGRRIGART